MQGAVINVVTRQGSERFLYDASYYGQPAGLTSQPVQLVVPGPGRLQSGYERVRYRDLTTNIGGPAIRDRLWFFAGYQYLRDYDSQPGTDPAFPRTYEQDKIFAKLTWKLAPGLAVAAKLPRRVLGQPRAADVREAVRRPRRTARIVPAITFGDLTHTLSANTVWDVRVGRFVFDQDDPPSRRSDDGEPVRPPDECHERRATADFGGLTIIRTTAKATVSHYPAPGLWAPITSGRWAGSSNGASTTRHRIIPTGVRFVDDIGVQGRLRPSRALPRTKAVSHVTASAFASDAITMGDRLTINAGVRFDHSRAISQDLPRARSVEDMKPTQIDRGLGHAVHLEHVSRRASGVTMKLTADGRTMLRASYGRFSQGVLTGEIRLRSTPA